MDSPEYTERTSRGLIYTVFRRFLRVATDAGDILAEFGAAHVVREPDWSRWPWPIPAGGVPEGSIMLDRYGGMEASRHGVTPVGIMNTPERRALLRAVLSMRAADVSHMQNDDNGCGAAVLARLAGIGYAEAVAKIGRGIVGTKRLAAATGTTRHICKARTWEEVEQAGAIAALIRNDDPRLGRHYGHYVSIDPGMVIVDPELVLRYPLADYPRKAWTPQMYFCRE